MVYMRRSSPDTERCNCINQLSSQEEIGAQVCTQRPVFCWFNLNIHSNKCVRRGVWGGGGQPSHLGPVFSRGALPLLKVVGTCRWTGYDFPVINIGTAYLNRPNWLLAGYSVYHRVASQGFPDEFPAHNVYDRPAISAPATVRAGRNRFRVFSFLFIYCKTTIGQGISEVCNIATGYAYESF